MGLPPQVASWSVDDVVTFLAQIGLPHLAEGFRDNAVNGNDLAGLTDEDFKESLGCTGLQVRPPTALEGFAKPWNLFSKLGPFFDPYSMQVKKIHRELQAYGGPAVAAAVAPSAVAPPAATPTPAPAAPAPAPPVAAAAAAPAAAPVEQQKSAHDLEQRAAAAAGHAHQYAQGQALLRQAEAELRSAAKSLTITQVSGATEMMQDMRLGRGPGRRLGPGGPGIGRRGPLDRRNDLAHNAIEMATVQRANGMMKQAAAHIEQARQILPALPFIQPANVRQAMGGVFFNAFFAPGVMGDLMQASKVHKAKAAVEQMCGEVVQALDWATNNLNAAQAEVSSLKAAAAAH
jgi:hypothetical protein